MSQNVGLNRRAFLRNAGMTAVVAVLFMVIAACYRYRDTTTKA